jgi:hypothetical protein
MGLPRVRFTVRRMMLAVGVLASVLAGERLLYLYSANLVSSAPKEGHLWGEAVAAWTILNALVALPVCVAVGLVIFSNAAPGPVGISTRLWTLVGSISLASLCGILASILLVLCAWMLAPTALGLALYRIFLVDIPESRIGREIGALTLYVVGVPGLNTSGRPGDDWTLMFKEYYPPRLLPSVILGLVVGLGVIYSIARKQARRVTE